MVQRAALKRLSLKAKNEIGESNVDIHEQVKLLRNVLQDLSFPLENYETLRLPPNFDDFLMRCLRVRKFDVARAAKLVSNYFKVLNEISDMHSHLMPSSQKDVYDLLGIAVLKHRDSEGRTILLARQEPLPAGEFSFDKSLAASMLVIDEINRRSVDTQRLGIVFVIDWKGFTLAHLRQTSPSRLRTCVKIFQDAFPARFKAFHFIRNPLLVSYFYAIVKPFLGDKIRNRVHFHGHDMNNFFKYVSPDILPQFLNGNLNDDDYMDAEFTSRLVTQDSYYSEVLSCGYNNK
ncbi:Retinaldehyde-binding protein 1 [Orchesella cincta]|uniref:Retinaldehyde-binding protein 1 n=1 Tax=Orchesella cincta TaxID=48709 RepID=A0A1D2N948_ORCCI|nr:Retinaldehyde-binding protein 1 [Orchesella cincta]